MLRNWILIPLIILLSGLAAGCSSANFGPLNFNAAPWHSGEVSEYIMRNSAGESIGTASIRIASGADANGNAIWNLQRDLLSEGDQQLSVVEMHADTLRPTLSIWAHSRDNDSEMIKTAYNGTQADLELTSVQSVMTNQRISIPSDARDEQTLATLIRALPLASGYATRINVFLPLAGATERAEIVVTGEEQIETPAGAFEAWRVNVNTESTASVAWVGKEAPYPLLKFQDDRSDVTFELTNFQPGE